MQGAAGMVLGGWQLSGILQLADGSPLTARFSFDHAKTGILARSDRSDRPDLISGSNNNPVLGDGRNPDNYWESSDPDLPGGQDSFVLQAPGVWGTVGRNTLILPGLATFDLSLQKNTPIAGERASLQFRAEFFNIFNRANFGTPSSTVFSSASGCTDAPSCAANASRSGSFGSISNTSTSARQIQFALKLLF